MKNIAIGCSVVSVIALLVFLVVVKWTYTAVGDGLEAVDETVTKAIENHRKANQIDSQIKNRFGIDVNTGFGINNGTYYLSLTLKNQTLPGATVWEQDQFLKTLACYYWQNTELEGYDYLEIRLETIEKSGDWEGESSETRTFQSDEMMARDWREVRDTPIPTAEPVQEEAPQKPKRKRREPYTVN